MLRSMAVISLPRFPQLSPDAARRATGLAMLTATAFFFGGAMVAGKVAVAEVPPFTVAATRSGSRQSCSSDCAWRGRR